MKIAVYFLAVICCVMAREMPFLTADELEVTKLTPIDLHLEPIGPAKPEVAFPGGPGGRIIGGSIVTPNSVPYQAAVIINNSEFCGGSLISTNRVLTIVPSGTVGACNGDSGGPLVVNGVEVGIVSFGSANCLAGNPTVYARVSSFRDWIATNGGV